MVDDVQFLIDKERSQEEFFHTFNALFHANKQIVLSSDKPPSQLKTLEERLSSRFGSGLVVDITKPDYETRLAILEKKAETEKFPIQGDMLQYLARNISSNIRDLEGAFIRVVAKAKLSKVPIDMALLTEAIKDVTSSSNLRPLDIPLIIEIVAEKYNVSPEELKSKKRTAALSSARHVAMYLTRKIMDERLTAIGLEFGGRDHSTVVHAIDKITEVIELNKVFEQELHDLEKDIRSVAR
jgi:chromosomal replication initiator protein